MTDMVAWTGLQANERREGWKALTLDDIGAARYRAEQQIADIMGVLYLETGCEFSVERCEVLRSSWMTGPPLTETYRGSYCVTLSAKI